MSSESTASNLRVPSTHAQNYLSRNEGITLTSSTVRTYDAHLTEYVQFLHGRGTNVLEAEFEDVLQFIEKCVRRNNRQGTITGKLTTIAELYRYIRLRTDDADNLSLDPIEFRDINLNRYNTPEPIEREALSREEIRRLFDAFESYRNRLMAVVGIETGLRNSDIRNLRLQDVNEDYIHVHDPKGSKPYDVPISTELAFELEHWEGHQRRGYAAAPESSYVFVSQDGPKLESNGSLNEIVKKAAERAGLQEVIARTAISEEVKETLNISKDHREWHRVTAHTLRHSFVTLLKDAGVSLPYRSLLANHSNLDTTRGYESGVDDVFSDVRDRFDPPR